MGPDLLTQVLGLLVRASTLMARQRLIEELKNGLAFVVLPVPEPEDPYRPESSAGAWAELEAYTRELAKTDPKVARGFYGEQAAFDVATAVEALMREHKLTSKVVQRRSGLTAPRLRAILEGSGAGKTSLADLAVVAHAAGTQLQVVFVPLPEEANRKSVQAQAQQVSDMALRLVRNEPLPG